MNCLLAMFLTLLIGVPSSVYRCTQRQKHASRRTHKGVRRVNTGIDTEVKTAANDYGRTTSGFHREINLQ